VLDDEKLRDLARRMTAVPGVVGVMLGGSRARDDHTPDSDVDLGVYYRVPLDVEGLGDLARQVAGPSAEVTEPGAWGPWVDGGGWLDIEGTAVDWIYRDLDRVRLSCSDASAGRIAFHAQVGHPLGVPNFGYAGEIALGAVLSDPSGSLATLKDRMVGYPPRLSEAVVTAGLWEAGFTIGIARKAVARADTVYVAGCLFRAVELCAHALHAHAGRWLINEKGAVASAGRLPGAPDDFASRAMRVLAHLGDGPDALAAAIAAATDLLADVTTACGRTSQ
jgi:hypothetical protein